MDSEFRKKVFDEELFDFCLELLSLTENIAAVFQDADFTPSSELLRKTVNNAFTTSTSRADILAFLKTLNLIDFKSFKDQLPLFFENANLAKSHNNALYEDYLTTVRHLAEHPQFSEWEGFFESQKNIASLSSSAISDFLRTTRHLVGGEVVFPLWSDLFKVVTSLSGADSTVMIDFSMTVRHLVASGSRFDHWPEFLKVTSALSGMDALIINDFFMTVRHLTLPAFNFSSWSAFFKAITVLVEKKPMLLPFMTMARHCLGYFKKQETLVSLFSVLSSQNKTFLFDAYSYGQLESKKWLIEELRKIRGDQWGTTFVLASWIGSLAQLMFDSNDLKIEKIRSFDIDTDSCKIAEKLNNAQVLEQWKFKAVCMDVSLMEYPTVYFVKRHDGSVVELYDTPEIIINTSCEHIDNLQGWWAKIPAGTTLVLQNNNAFNIPDHKNCVSSLEEFKMQLPLTQIDYEGSLELSDYTRYMLIGKK